MVIKEQEQTTTKQQATRKFHIDELHVDLIHSVEYRMLATTKHQHYIVKGALEVFK